MLQLQKNKQGSMQLKQENKHLRTDAIYARQHRLRNDDTRHFTWHCTNFWLSSTSVRNTF